jgi:hypothetical protein
MATLVLVRAREAKDFGELLLAFGLAIDAPIAILSLRVNIK